MPKEYIEREAAERILYDGCHTTDGREVLDDVAELWHMIQDLPAADVVEVVRCRDCYFREFDGADVPVCTGAMAYSYTPDDWFCAVGKPRDGGQDDV